MKKNILISLVSEQTIPNVQLIKEFSNQIDEFVFVHSIQTEKEVNWIKKSTNVSNSHNILVNPFDLKAIEEVLKNEYFEDNNYYLNLTGGTKLMIIAFYEYFKNLGATIFYLTGQNSEYIKVFPAIGTRTLNLKSKLTIEEYLNAYGFEFGKSKLQRDRAQAQKILDLFLNGLTEAEISTFNKFRLNRDKGITISDDEQVIGLLAKIDFSPKKMNVLNSKETKYLSGEWLEEYVFFNLITDLGLSEDEIWTGVHLSKQNTPNELDVLFILENKFYIIECKTSIFDDRILPDGTTKRINLLPEIIYKSDALRSKFGIFANTSILTLDELKDENGFPLMKFKTSFERADLSKIKVLSKRDFISSTPMYKLLGIHK